MARWTFLMLAILAIATVLSSLDIIQNLELYKERPNHSSFRQAIKQGAFRTVSPATAEFLEDDVKFRLQNMADKEVSGLKDKTPQERSRWRRIIFYFNGLVLFLVAVVAVFIFVGIPLRGIFKSRKRWCDEVGKSDGLQGPGVPYLPKAWRKQVPRMLHILIFFHYLFGGLVNLAAAVFCLDGLSYLFVGRTLLIARSANLWSWIFATSEIVMGVRFGQLAGAVLVLAINTPILLVLMTYARRLLRKVFLGIHISFRGFNDSETFGEKYLLVDKYISDVCLKSNINRPVLFLAKDRNALVRLHWLSLTGKPVIEITRGAFELLFPDELKVVIAHELGHIRQGLWKIRILKFLSSAALFPNHYLTLCLNWSQKEIHADKFALELTRDPESLKNALVKISAAQTSYLRGSSGQQKTSFSNSRLASKISAKWHSIMISARFFWGDNLFGYAHPYLSERLEMLDVYTPKRKFDNASG
jgi:Zn-dependent protease with chaperone function